MCVSITSSVEERRGKCNGGKGREMTAQSIVQRPVTHSCSQYKQIEEIAMEQAHMDVRGRLEWTKVKRGGMRMLMCSSQDDALDATSVSGTVGSEGFWIFRTGVPIAHRAQASRSTILGSSSLLLLPLLSEHANDIVKGLLNVDAVLGGRLDEFAAQVLRQGLSFLR